MKTFVSVLGVILLLAACAFGQNGHGINLTWTQSTSPGVTSNNVYRGASATGPWTQIYKSTAPITSYLDQTGTPGTTYYYSVSAVANGAESAMDIDTTSVVYPPQPPTGLVGSVE